MFVHFGFYCGNAYVGPTITYEHSNPPARPDILANLERELVWLYPEGTPADLTWVIAESEKLLYTFPPVLLATTFQDR
jgi:hypothetical protein